MRRFELFLLTVFFLISKESSSQCTTPPRGSFSNVTTTSASISNSCPGCTGTLLFEYGPFGFTPGTGATAGAGGTVVTVANPSVYSMTGLTPNTTYTYYTRQNCSGTFSANSLISSFSTLFDCSTAPAVTLNTMVTGSVPSGPGTVQSCYGLYSREIIYAFTPATSGSHLLFLPPYISGNPVYFAYAPVSNGCVTTGFTCIGRSESTIQQHTFGPLTAGTAYYLRLSSYNGNLVNNFSFRIERPGCTPPSNIAVADQSPTTFTVTFSGSGGYLEYGPSGLIPGVGSTPGTNGTVINAASGVTVTGLTPFTLYDFYLRSSCGAGSYSNNSTLTTVTTMPCPSTTNYGSLGTLLQLINWGGSYPFGVYGASHILGCWPDGYGDEKNVKFNAPVTGNYKVAVNNFLSGPGSFPQLNFAFRQANGSCDLNNYECQTPVTTTWPYYSDYIINIPNAANTYDLLFDVVDSFASGSVEVLIKCAGPDNVSLTNITPNSTTINFNCNCPNATYIEYGSYGFTPGTGATAGGGTLLSNVSSPVTLSALTSYTDYSVFIRTSCGGNFSDNTFYSFKTKTDCANAPLLNCGSSFIYDLVIGNTGGLWQNYTCGAAGNTNVEKVFRFTPPLTGTYTLNNIQSTGWVAHPVSAYYKVASGSCDESGWTCLGTITASPQLISWGPLTAGTTYLLLLDAAGNIGSTTKTVRIECPAPCTATIAASGPTTICSGNSVTLNANTGTGISYQWIKDGNNIAGAVSSSYTTSAGGIYAVIETRATCGTINSNTISITVALSPSSTITPSTSQNFCTGSGITLQANTGTGLTYQWKKNNSNINGANNASYLANTTGSFTVVVTNSSACSKTSAAVYVTGPPSNTVSALGPTHFCTGGNVTLKSVSGQAVTYKWKKNGAYISGATSQTYVATSTGSYNCIVTNSFGCSKGGTAIAVTGPPSAVITANGPTSFCAGGSVLLSAAAGYTYQWIKNSVNIGGALSQNYSATTAGNYKVKVTDPFGCSKTTPTTNQITVTVPCREVSFADNGKSTDEGIRVFPNPFSGSATILISPGIDLKDARIEMYNMLGEKIKSFPVKEYTVLINRENMATGMYVLRLVTSEEMPFTCRISIE